jgi:prepilin-type processing-associated H-X9-DG protein
MSSERRVGVRVVSEGQIAMNRARRGFSLYDLVGVLMVVGVLALVWLAAIQRAREASRRALCVNNLKQIAQALASYESTHRCYPLGVTASFNPLSEGEISGVRTPGVPTNWSGWSANAVLLNYLNEVPLYQSINFDFEPLAIGPEKPFNATAVATRVGVFMCPNDPNTRKQMLNNYYANIGTNVQSRAHRPTGVFGYQFLCTTRDITDGQANTVAFAEGLSGDFKAHAYRGNGVINSGKGFPNPETATAELVREQLFKNLQDCNDGFAGLRFSTGLISANRGEYWAWGCEAMTLFNTIVPPNSTQYGFNQCRYECLGCYIADADHSDITNASSYHPGGANALFCDGSVHFVRGSIAMPTWWAVGTRGSGDVVSGDSF